MGEDLGLFADEWQADVTAGLELCHIFGDKKRDGHDMDHSRATNHIN